MSLFSFSSTNNKKGNYRISAFTACLLIAIIFWLLNSLTKTYSHKEEFELVYEKIPFNKQPANPLPKYAQITFDGSGYNLLWLNIKKPFKNLRVVMPQSSANTFPEKYQVSVADCFAKQYTNSIHSLKLNFTEPDSIHFVFSEKLIKKVPVKLNATINYKTRYSSINGVELENDSILISGTESALNSISEIETETLTFNNLSKKTLASVKLINPNPTTIFLDKTQIEAVINVNEITESKVIVNILPPASAKKIMLITAQVTVTYKTTLDNLKKINASEFVIATVQSDVDGQLLPVVKKHPSFVEVVFIDPPVIKFLTEE